MEKDFDRWDALKKQVNAGEALPLYHAREIWWAHLGVNVGYEQDGTGPSYERPVLIIRGLSPYVCLVVPLTTSKKRDRFYITAGLVEGKRAAAIVSQIRLIDTRRLISSIQYEKRPENYSDRFPVLPRFREGEAEAICTLDATPYV
jgi:mRNA interferase MazF